MSTQKQRKAGKAPGRLSHLQCCSCDSTRKPDRNLTLERSNQSSFQNQCRDHSGQGARPRRQAAAQHPWIPTDPAPRLQLRAAPFDGASSTIIRGYKPPQPTIFCSLPPSCANKHRVHLCKEQTWKKAVHVLVFRQVNFDTITSPICSPHGTRPHVLL